MNASSGTKRNPEQESQPVVYLVDDEKLLLDLAEVALKDNGYVLKKFHDPSVALKAFLRAKTKPAVLITDYAMGKMNGMELIEKCKQCHPELKSILISGTAGAEIIVGSPVKVDRFLGKPYQTANLAETVRNLLESQKPPTTPET
jgi:DNA-binding NtrC family response regulator